MNKRKVHQEATQPEKKFKTVHETKKLELKDRVPKHKRKAHKIVSAFFEPCSHLSQSQVAWLKELHKGAVQQLEEAWTNSLDDVRDNRIIDNPGRSLTYWYGPNQFQARVKHIHNGSETTIITKIDCTGHRPGCDSKTRDVPDNVAVTTRASINKLPKELWLGMWFIHHGPSETWEECKCKLVPVE